MRISPDRQSHDHGGNLDPSAGRQRRGDEIKDRRKCEDRVPEGWEVMVEEQLTAHEIEREVMQCPTHDEETSHLVVFDDGGMVEILVSTLLTEDEEDADDKVRGNACSAHPPGERISDEIDVSVLLDPKVDTATESRPVPWARVICMAAGESSIRPPHDLLEFPPFTEESRELVVDLWRVGRNCGLSARENLNVIIDLTERVGVSLDEPKTVHADGILVTRNFLLLESPVGKFDLVECQKGPES